MVWTSSCFIFWLQEVSDPEKKNSSLLFQEAKFRSGLCIRMRVLQLQSKGLHNKNKVVGYAIYCVFNLPKHSTGIKLCRSYPTHKLHCKMIGSNTFYFIDFSEKFGHCGSDDPAIFGYSICIINAAMILIGILILIILSCHLNPGQVLDWTWRGVACIQFMYTKLRTKQKSNGLAFTSYDLSEFHRSQFCWWIKVKPYWICWWITYNFLADAPTAVLSAIE